MLKKTTESTEKLTYRQPKVYSLGSLDKVQAGQLGNMCDGPDGWYYYSR